MLRRTAISALLLCVTFAASARTRPHYGGTLRIEVRGDAWAPDGLARRLVLNGLTSLSNTGVALPALATRWSERNHDQRWEIHLRSGVRFQDGTALTADTVIASLTSACSNTTSLIDTSQASPTPCPWNTVYAAGPFDVVITASNPVPDLPALLAQARFAIARKDQSGVLQGTGPFRVAGFTNGALTLTAYNDCWQGRPFLDSVEIFQHRSIRDQWLDLSVGRTDIVQVPPEMLRQAKQQHLNVLESSPVDLLALTLPTQGVFASAGARGAAAFAIDRMALYNVIFQKQGEVTGSLLPQDLSGYAFLFPTDRDLNRARALRGGDFPARVMLGEQPEEAIMHLAAERLALNLHEAGFNVRIAPPGAAAPMQLRLVHLEETSPRPALDEILTAFRLSTTVNGVGSDALWQAEHSALQEHTVIPLLWLPRAWAIGERVRDFQLSSDGEPQLANLSLEGAK